MFSNKREKGCRSGWEIVTIIYWRKKNFKRKEEPLANTGGRVNYEIGGSFLRKLEIELPCGPAITSILSRRHLHTVFIVYSIYSSKEIESTWMSINR